MLNETAFFPGGRGLWTGDSSGIFPSILVLGQDFSTVKVYEDMKIGLVKDLNSPTWKNLIKLFNEARVDFKKCFFSNVFMGLREIQEMTGKFLGGKDKEFVKRNLSFLSFQIETIRPKLIITLGRPASEMISKLSTPDLDCWKAGKALSSPNEGFKRDVSFKDHLCHCIALEHTSMRNSNVKRRVYGKYTGHRAEVEMLKEAMEGLGNAVKS